MIASWLLSSSWGAGISSPGARRIVDFRGSSELSRDDHEHSFVETTFINVFDQCRNGLVVGGGPEPHRVKNVVIDSVIIPIVHASTQGTA